MKIRKIRVGVSLTIPLEAYSNIKPGVELEADLDEDDLDANGELDVDKAHNDLYQKAKTLMMRQCFDMGEDMGKMRDDFDGYLQAFFNLR